MKYEIRKFKNANVGLMRVLLKDDGYYFAVSDCVNALGYKSAPSTITKKYNIWQIKINPYDTDGGHVPMCYCQIEGVMALVKNSKSPEKRKSDFKSWIFDEIIPKVSPNESAFISGEPVSDDKPPVSDDKPPISDSEIPIVKPTIILLNGNSVLSAIHNGRVWFSASGLLGIYGIKNHEAILNELENGDKAVFKVDWPQKLTEVKFINEIAMQKIFYTIYERRMRMFGEWVREIVSPKVAEQAKLDYKKSLEDDLLNPIHGFIESLRAGLDNKASAA